MGLVKVGEHFVDELYKFHRRLVIELDHAQVAHEGWSVEHVNDQLNFLCVEMGCLLKDFVSTSLTSCKVAS